MCCALQQVRSETITQNTRLVVVRSESGSSEASETYRFHFPFGVNPERLLGHSAILFLFLMGPPYCFL